LFPCNRHSISADRNHTLLVTGTKCEPLNARRALIQSYTCGTCVITVLTSIASVIFVEIAFIFTWTADLSVRFPVSDDTGFSLTDLSAHAGLTIEVAIFAVGEIGVTHQIGTCRAV
jgi:hypothetical protein